MSTNAFFDNLDEVNRSSTSVACASTIGRGLLDCLRQFLARWPDWPQHMHSPRLMRHCHSTVINRPSGPRTFVGIAGGTMGGWEEL